MAFRDQQRFHKKIMARKPTRGDVIKRYMLLDEIDWDSLKPVGGGGFGFVFRNNEYAVKIGDIDAHDVKSLATASGLGYAVPLYAYFPNAYIPASFRNKHKRLPSYGLRTEISSYVNDNGHADILVMGIAKPLAPHKYAISNAREAEINELVTKLSDEVRGLGYIWTDRHAWNIGKYGDKVVILDGGFYKTYSRD